MNWASDFLIAKQGMNRVGELIEQKKYREAHDLLIDIQQAEYKLRHYVAGKLADASSSL